MGNMEFGLRVTRCDDEDDLNKTKLLNSKHDICHLFLTPAIPAAAGYTRGGQVSASLRPASVR
jgi:hypothetical protein